MINMLVINKVLNFMTKHKSDLDINIRLSKFDNKVCLYATCKTCKQENRYPLEQ